MRYPIRPLRALLSCVALAVVCHAGDAAASDPAAARLESQARAEQPPVDLEKLTKQRFVRQTLYRLNSRVARYLEKAEQASSGGDPDEALRLLGKLDPERLNPYERAYVFRLIAIVHYVAGRYPQAIEFLEKVLDEEILYPQADNAIRFNIAQLYAATQRWPDVVKLLHEWLRYAPKPTSLAHYLLAIAHYQLDEAELAIADAVRAVELSPEPDEGWLQLLAALYAQQSDYDKAAPVLEQLLLRFPKKQYWVQLSLIYGAREKYKESLAVQQIAYAQGFLTEDSELRRLARSCLFNDLPYQAALVLEKGLEDEFIERDAPAYELLANSWIQAREYGRALVPLRRAAELSDEGNLFVRLGQVHMQNEDWAAAVEAFQRAVEKGRLEHPGAVDLLLGISHYNDHRVESARRAFVRARRHEATREQAEQWMAHIAKETSSG